ncbi:hypothetical protein HNQ91_002960 [Filimonas zeae]|uniref:DUF6908 domain-containing protein n=1 Tax=Filimonas zeae TaxID=1737353 RepID=A0A917J1S5_9BACT|nr:hypothetical protein [Filimonas zeae]MDR6339895.1 hypothetical protein [Filimonas zeae]GGH70185.1 hypothetical protein GCM10011379_28200 [Filimonas zeae]
MKMLNLKATDIFCQLLDSMAGKETITFTTAEFMPLVLECFGVNINAPAGDARLYSLAHYYEEKGRKLFDPCMHFIVVDLRHILNRPQMVAIFPYQIRQDNTGFYQESITIKSGRLAAIDKVMQRDHTLFAAQWLVNIQRQGFLE